MTLGDLDPILSTPKRLAAMGIISTARKVDFSYIRDQLEVSDSDLSKQLKPLVDGGYVSTRKTGRGVTRRTWISITAEGAAALESHAAALQGLIRPVVDGSAVDRPADGYQTAAE